MAVNAPRPVFICGLKKYQHGFTPRFHPLNSASPKGTLKGFQVLKGKEHRLRCLAANGLMDVVDHAAYFGTLGHACLHS